MDLSDESKERSYFVKCGMVRRPYCVKDGLNKGAWTPLEDKILITYITAHGEGNWPQLSIRAGLNRCGKSCRLRWKKYLSPEIKRGNISHDEEELIIRLHNLLGNRWSLIAGRLPGRTDNEIKNYWNTTLGKQTPKLFFSKKSGQCSPLSPKTKSTRALLHTDHSHRCPGNILDNSSTNLPNCAMSDPAPQPCKNLVMRNDSGETQQQIEWGSHCAFTAESFEQEWDTGIWGDGSELFNSECLAFLVASCEDFP